MAPVSNAKSDISDCRPYFVLLSNDKINKTLKKNLLKHLPSSFPFVFKQAVKHLLIGNLNSEDSKFVENNVERLKYITEPKTKERKLKLILSFIPGEYYRRVGCALYEKCVSCK